ncbi:MAG: rod shape-determining protein RodA [Cyclobacteriaceae bacterium]|nr:rod shape-determining protein RodA [Cyclobacteriaceae bacterium]
MRRADNITNNIDWTTIFLYLGIVTLGWLNIYAAVYDESTSQNIFDYSLNSGKQLIWIASSIGLIIIIIAVDYKFYERFGFYIYGLVILLLLLVIPFGVEIAGSNSWFAIGGFRVQPSEFSKFATALAIAKYAGSSTFRLDKVKNQIYLGAFIVLPLGLIVLQGDAGTALVFTSLILVLYREGMHPLLLVLGVSAAAIFILTLLVENTYLYIAILVIVFVFVMFNRKRVKRIILAFIGALLICGVILSVDYLVTEVLKPHQQNRIKALINPSGDPLGYGWNVTQSKIAIGSGGLMGKGFLNGTQTKGDFVPEQSTDFIFCTIGEEHGWVGSLILIGLFITLLLRIIFISERQKWRFARIYGYSVACIIFFHFAVNIGMTIGLFPVIGIPLPFFSYGGSSLWSFTILLFILVKLDAHRMQVLIR